MSHARAISAWLFVVCGMILGMIVLGGLTRLTHSGLSMVHWQPVTGWLPPLNDAEWNAVFDAYKGSPEFTKVNYDMTVDGFKGIFWLEFIHRLLGRTVGVAFFLPFLFFMFKGWIDRRIAPSLVFFFVLGALQGGMGWFMVKSGLVDHPDVSQYRLTAHLGLAVFIYAVMLRFAFRLRRGYDAVRPMLYEDVSLLRKRLLFLAVLIFITILSGGFVAGLDAGLTYNTFPFMDGKLIPDQLYDGDPFFISAFEDILTVQFNHRILALSTLLIVVLIWLMSFGVDLSQRQRRGMMSLILASVAQVSLGITTLLLVVPVSVASLHQFGAIILLSAAIYAVYTLEWSR
ncbi:MAG: heme A synthase [Rhodospirillales bacterium]|nr:heme A synthase [Rhodospirillales bacterium]